MFKYYLTINYEYKAKLLILDIMQGSTSKLRNVYGETYKEKYEDVKPHDTTTEGSLIDCNAHFIAVYYF